MRKSSNTIQHLWKICGCYSCWGDKLAFRTLRIGLFGRYHLSHKAAVGQGTFVAWQQWKICHLTITNYGNLWKIMGFSFFVRTGKLWKWMKMAPVCRWWFADSRYWKALPSNSLGLRPISVLTNRSISVWWKSHGESFEAHGPSGNPWQQNIPCKVEEWEFVERNRKLRAASSFVFPIGGILVWNFSEQDFLLDFRLCQVSVPKNHPWFGQAPLFWGGRVNPNNQDDLKK